MREIIPVAEGHDGMLGLVRDSKGLTEVHSHVELEFNLVVSGSTYYIVGDRRYLLTPGSLIWLFPAQEHLLVDYDRDFSMWVAVLKRGLVEDISATCGRESLAMQDPGEVFVRRISLKRWHELDALCSSVARGDGDTRRFNYGLAYCAMEAWSAYTHGDSLESGADLSPVVSAALRILSESGGCDSLSAIAKRLAVSSTWLSRAFHRETATRFVDYCNRLKLMRFLEVRQRFTAATLTEVAMRAGFGSYAQFYRVFREAYGHGPGSVRRVAYTSSVDPV